MGENKNIQSLDRALDIIEAVAVGEKMSLTDISNSVNLSKSTTFRILSTLTDRKYIQKTEDGKYKLGLKLIEIVSYYINSLELLVEARPYISMITSHLGLTAHLGILNLDKVVYINKIDVISNVRLYSQIGVKMEAYCSSLGKCLLANYSKQELNELMKINGFTKYTDKTITNIDDLWKEILSVRSRGWALEDEEYEVGHRCIGAPIYDYRGDIIAAISASEHKSVLTEERYGEVSKYVMNIAMEISKLMGYIC